MADLRAHHGQRVKKSPDGAGIWPINRTPEALLRSPKSCAPSDSMHLMKALLCGKVRSHVRNVTIQNENKCVMRPSATRYFIVLYNGRSKTWTTIGNKAGRDKSVRRIPTGQECFLARYDYRGTALGRLSSTIGRIKPEWTNPERGSAFDDCAAVGTTCVSHSGRTHATYAG